MADDRNIPAPEERPEIDSLLSDDLWNNIFIGANSAKMGAEQAATEFGEMIGILPPGTSESVTGELKQGREELLDRTVGSQRMPGASAVQTGMEVAPALLIPFGRSKAAASLFGAGAGSIQFQENVDDSRLPTQALGAAIGFGTRVGLDAFTKLRGGGPARKSAEAEILAIESGRAGQRALPAPSPQLPPPPVLRGEVMPREANIVPARASQGRLFEGRVVPDAGRLEGPQGLFSAPSRSPTAGLVAEDFLPGASAPSVLSQAPRASGPRAGLSKSQEMLAFRKITALDEQTKKLAKAIKDIEKAVAKRPNTKATKKLEELKAKRGATRTLREAGKARLTKEKAATPVKHRAWKTVEQDPRVESLVDETDQEGIFPKRNGNGYWINLKPGVRHPDQGASIHEPTKKAAMARLNEVVNEEVPRNAPVPKGQRGSADPALLGGIARAGVGSVVGAGVAGATGQDPLSGAVVGAAGGLAAPILLRGAQRARAAKKGVQDAARDASKHNAKVTGFAKARNFSTDAIADALTGARNVADEFLGASLTRIEQISPRVGALMRQAEWNQHNQANKWIKTGDVAWAKLDKAGLTDVQDRTFKKFWLNSTEGGIRYLRSQGKGEAADAMAEIQGVMKDAESYLKDVDLGGFTNKKGEWVSNLRTNYAPRSVVDTSAFETIQWVKSHLDQLAKKKDVDLTDFQKEMEITNLLNGALLSRSDAVQYARASANLKQRTVKVTDKNVDAYGDPKVAYNDYVESVTKQVERRRFFGQQGVNIKEMGAQAESLQGVGSQIAKQLTRGGMSKEDAGELVELLKARFGPGEQAPHRFWQNFKNLTYAGLLGNPLAAATQFGDVAISMHKNGVRNTVEGLSKVLAGKGKINGLDKESLLGIRNAAADFDSRTPTRDILNWSLKWGGFQHMDRFGKNTFIQSAMLKNQNMGKEEFVRKWRPLFDVEGGDAQVEQLWDQVQRFEKITPENQDSLGFMLWNELSDAQPIALSALPQRYHMHPNGRVGYMLQSFTLKQFDIIRRDIVSEFGAGNIAQGTAKMARFATFFVMMNGSTDQFKSFITGKDEGVGDTVLNNTLKMFGGNKFMVEQIGREGLGKGLLGAIAPPTAVPDAIGDLDKMADLVPILGRTTKRFRDAVE